MPTPKLIDLHPPMSDFQSDIVRGLTAARKRIPSIYHYNEEGSRLFEKICELNEYYLTRAELEIFDRAGPEIATALGNEPLMIEYGCGNSRKIELLLKAIHNPAGYAPVDISKDHLLETALKVQSDYPQIKVVPICADFTKAFDLPDFDAEKKIVFFPGSTIGNFERTQAIEILKSAAHHVGTGGGLLLGADLIKDREILEKAYDDSEGVTAQFNLNLLKRINDEIQGDFDLNQFQHKAFYNEKMHRIEAYLESKKNQTVKVADKIIKFKKGERIHTENSHKYSLESIKELAGAAGFKHKAYWTDKRNLFSVHYFVVF